MLWELLHKKPVRFPFAFGPSQGMCRVRLVVCMISTLVEDVHQCPGEAEECAAPESHGRLR